MEAERENSENTELFWRLFVEAQRKVAGNKYTDMVGANMNGVRRVFGEEVLQPSKSCEFHFK